MVINWRPVRIPGSDRGWRRNGSAWASAILLAATLVVALPVSAAGADDCATTLQSLVDAAPSGAVLELPGCIYRETVTIRQPVALRGSTGTEIRGSDVWSDWQSIGESWRSVRTVPLLSGTGGTCRPDTDECHMPEQVFVDGVAQRRVSGSPASGEFSLTADRRVEVGGDPIGHLVEVSVRERWLQISAPDVRVEGLTFRHAANGPQGELAALRVSDGADRFTLARSHLFEAHGALLGLVGGSGHLVDESELALAGQEGFGMVDVSDTAMVGTHIHDNNSAGFDPTWEAGAGKAGVVRGLRFERNVVSGNAGPGLWCDIDCRDVEFTGNRIDHNENAGIMFEISAGAVIRDNVLIENGWGHAAWGWGAGILLSSSASVQVANNTLAWNADGISVISQDRPNRPDGSGTNVVVTGNTVLAAPQPTDRGPSFLLAWLDTGSGDMYRSGSGNRGEGNQYWSSEPETTAERFYWAAPASSLAAFSATPGGQGDRYLTTDEVGDVVQGLEIPVRPEAHEVRELLSTRLRIVTTLVIALGGIAIMAVIAVLARWRLSSRHGSNPSA